VEAMRAGRTLDAPRVEQAVSSMTESVLRNPDALLLFSQLKEKGDYTTSHAVDVAVYMTAFGRFLQLPTEDISLLGYLGLLQDVGKTRLPTELLNKRNRLSEAEFAQAKQHVQHSIEILRETPGLPPGLPELALLHHERQDGSGYPKGLKGKDIGLLGSIAGIVDTFDALTARRPYAEPVPPSAALSMLYKGRGSLFDPVLIEQFIRCIGIFPLGSTVELNSGEIGIVIAQNLEKRLQPRVMVIRDAQGHPMVPHKILDLAREPKAKKDESYRILGTLEHGQGGLSKRRPKIDQDHLLPADDHVEHTPGQVASHQVDLLRPQRARKDAHSRAVVDDVAPEDFFKVWGGRLRGARD